MIMYSIIVLLFWLSTLFWIFWFAVSLEENIFDPRDRFKKNNETHFLKG